MTINIFDKYYLSTEGYYFMYRPDKYDHEVLRATLYEDKNNNKQLSDVRVSEEYGVPMLRHHQVINYFESQITLGRI